MFFFWGVMMENRCGSAALPAKQNQSKALVVSTDIETIHCASTQLQASSYSADPRPAPFQHFLFTAAFAAVNISFSLQMH